MVDVSCSNHPPPPNYDLPKKKRKFRKHTDSLSDTAPPPTTLTQLRKKIRDLTRLLNRSNVRQTPTSGDDIDESITTPSAMPATVRLANERALEAYKHEFEQLKRRQQEKKIADRYKMVKFFEKQKATRKVRQCERELSNNPGSEEVKKRLHSVTVDLNYILYYPAGKKYISLFKDSRGDPKTGKEKENIRRDIERRMKEGTLGKRTDEKEELDKGEMEESEDEDEEDGGVGLESGQNDDDSEVEEGEGDRRNLHVRGKGKSAKEEEQKAKDKKAKDEKKERNTKSGSNSRGKSSKTDIHSQANDSFFAF